jgi:hypothetical protein
MSLINDALKKAQKQRTGDGQPLSTLPSVGGEPAARIAKRNKPLGFNSMMLWISAGGGALVVLLVGGFFLVRFMHSPPETPPAKPATVSVAQVAPPKPAEATPAPARPAESTGTTFVLPLAPTTATASAPVTVAPVIAETKPVVVESVAAAAPPPPSVESPRPIFKMEPKAVTYIEGVRVAGIRYSGSDSKVLMNDHVYRVGDIVEHQLGLKLAVISAGALTFEDERGARYTRNF